MAKRQQKRQQHPHPQHQHPHRQHRKGIQRQLLLNFWSPWLIASSLVVVLLAQLAVANAGNSISLSGNGNRLQQQELPGNEVTAGAEKHLTNNNNNNDVAVIPADDNPNDDEADVGEELNYVMQKSTAKLIPNSDEIMDDEDDVGLKGNGLGNNFLRNQFGTGYPLRMVKRAPGGFVGMRGKKSNPNGNDDSTEDLSDGYGRSLAFPWQALPDFDENAMNWDEYVQTNSGRFKKAPTAFYGVRGKKFTLGGGINPGGDAYRWQQFLQKLDEENVRHMIVDDFMDRLVNEPHSDVMIQQQNELTKRAPTGFTGLRGKRPELTEAGNDMSLESVGKRGLSNTFVGVRGKKDVSHQTFKRSPLGVGGGSERYFFDFWKKSSPNSGPGGKRQRFLDFGNKFVAVRGKKNSLNNDNSYAMQNLGHTLRWSSYSPLLSSMSTALKTNGLVTNDGSSLRLMYGNTGKRAPNGFVGMRGKRPSSTMDD